MAKGDAPISSIYRQGDVVEPGERMRRAHERKHSLYALLWLKFGVVCIHEDELPQDDPLAQHVVNIANEKYGRRHSGKRA